MVNRQSFFLEMKKPRAFLIAQGSIDIDDYYRFCFINDGLEFV